MQGWNGAFIRNGEQDRENSEACIRWRWLQPKPKKLLEIPGLRKQIPLRVLDREMVRMRASAPESLRTNVIADLGNPHQDSNVGKECGEPERAVLCHGLSRPSRPSKAGWRIIIDPVYEGELIIRWISGVCSKQSAATTPPKATLTYYPKDGLAAYSYSEPPSFPT